MYGLARPRQQFERTYQKIEHFDMNEKAELQEEVRNETKQDMNKTTEERLEDDVALHFALAYHQ